MEGKPFPTFPSHSVYEIMLLLYDHTECKFSTQDVFKDEKYFNDIMQTLARWKKIDVEDGHNLITKKNTPVFKINLNGRMWVEKNVFEWRNCIRC